MEVLISDHAKFEADRRDISLDIIRKVSQAPQQEIGSISGRTVCQSKMHDPATGREMLFRIIVKDTGDLRKVITVYKTSKIEKYWKVDD